MKEIELSDEMVRLIDAYNDLAYGGRLTQQSALLHAIETPVREEARRIGDNAATALDDDFDLITFVDRNHRLGNTDSENNALL